MTSQTGRGLAHDPDRSKSSGENIGLECEICGLADLRMLTRTALDGLNYATLCGNCYFLSGKQQMTVEELRRLRFPEGDQRRGERRNLGLRRHSSRRSPDREDEGDRRAADGRAK